MKKSETPLHVEIEDNQIVIRVGIDRLDGNDDHPDIPELPITNRKQWACDVVYELGRDRGDGATPLSLLFDDAMKSAIEMGSLGIDCKLLIVKDIKNKNL